jgi:hypothetical protein
MAKNDPKNVKKLAKDAAARSAKAKAEKAKKQPTVGGRIRRLGSDSPPPKGKPNAVLKLITDALKRQGKI